MEFITDLFKFILARKKWWLAPVILVLLIVGAIVIFGGNPVIGPFIYTLF